jgi:hypothetical protein
MWHAVMLNAANAGWHVFIVMLSVVTLSVSMLYAVMLSVVALFHLAFPLDFPSIKFDIKVDEVIQDT